MEWWFDWMEREGLFVSRTVLLLAPILFGLQAGIWAGDRWKTWIGWVLGLFVVFVGFSMFYPVIDLIDERGCQLNPDFEDCY